MLDQLQRISEEYASLNDRMSDPAVLGDHTELSKLSQRHRELEPIIQCFQRWKQAKEDLAEASELLDTDDLELRGMAEDEARELKASLELLEAELQQLLLPKDPNDKKNAVLEIRAGTGGDEAALFAADLYRMYLRYGERKGWKVEEVERNEIGLGGIKAVVAVLEAQGVYSRLKFESGVHRVQRVPETESQGRVHTSACTVAILPEAEDIDIDIEAKDLRIDVFRSSGPGGQSVNTTDSAVRITHVPTGIVVSCQDEKSQHKNKAKAMRILRARIQEQMEREVHDERAAQRKGMIGSGDRSERIRTYNFPQNRVTDHRIGLTLHKLDSILEGDLDELVDALTAADTAEKLAQDEPGA